MTDKDKLSGDGVKLQPETPVVDSMDDNISSADITAAEMMQKMKEMDEMETTLTRDHEQTQAERVRLQVELTRVKAELEKLQTQKTSLK
jgi:chromosome segregation ATPase